MPGGKERQRQIAAILDSRGDEIVLWYINGKSATAIGRSLGIFAKTVLAYLEQRGVPRRSLAEQRTFHHTPAVIPLTKSQVSASCVTLGQRIKALRQERGVSQRRLCLEIGITPAALCNIELNHRGVRFSTLVKIAHALNVDISTLVKENV